MGKEESSGPQNLWGLLVNKTSKSADTRWDVWNSEVVIVNPMEKKLVSSLQKLTPSVVSATTTIHELKDCHNAKTTV